MTEPILGEMPEWTQKKVFDPLNKGALGWSNNMIGTIEGLSNMAVAAINEVIARLNTIKINPPSWLEERGYDAWRVELNTVPNIAIPRLAKGGVIPPGLERLFIAGDNKTENEIIAPESTFRKIVREENSMTAEHIAKVQQGVTEEMERLIAKMCDAVEYENTKMAATIRAEANYKAGLGSGGTVVHNNDKGVSQTINIYQPVKSPAETSRAIKRTGRALANGY